MGVEMGWQCENGWVAVVVGVDICGAVVVVSSCSAHGVDPESELNVGGKGVKGGLLVDCANSKAGVVINRGKETPKIHDTAMTQTPRQNATEGNRRKKFPEPMDRSQLKFYFSFSNGHHHIFS